MNPYRIYRDEWAGSLALQTTATNYTTFENMWPELRRTPAPTP